jgi:hypothetical protein
VSAKVTRAWTSEGVQALLARKYAAPAWAFLPQVRDATGWGGSRTCDGIAMSLWPSRGLHVHGFEIKVYRGDWLRELKNPAKADAIQSYCDFWWVVAPDGIVLNGELPVSWGLIEVKGREARVKIQGPQLKPEPLETVFVAALLRRAAAALPSFSREFVAASEVEEEATRRAESIAREAHRDVDAYKKLLAQVEEFEKTSGISIRYGSDFMRTGQIVRLLGQRHTRLEFLNRLHVERESFLRAADSLEKISNLIDADASAEEIPR